MRAARGGKEVDQRAVDLFFDILDSDNDGVLSMEESDISNEMKVGQEGQQAVDASSHVQDGDGDVKPERLTEFSKKMRKAFWVTPIFVTTITIILDCLLYDLPGLRDIVEFSMEGAIQIEHEDFDMHSIPPECIVTDLDNQLT